MAARVALDSNILISGVVFHGLEERLVTGGLQGRFTFLLPRRVLVEARDVLHRDFPALTNAASVLDQIARAAQLIGDEAAAVALPRALTMIRDVNDAPVLAALLADPPDFFVTGDKDFLILNGRLPFPILRTRAMLALLEEG